MFTISTTPPVSGVSFNSNLLNADSGLTYSNGTDIAANVEVDSKLMMLKLKKARLETQVAFTRTQLLLVEMELRMAEKELHQEIYRSEAASASPQPKRPHKLVKLLKKVFKPTSNSNARSSEPGLPETSTTSTSDEQEIDLDTLEGVSEDSMPEKRRNVDSRKQRTKMSSSLDKKQNKENRDCIRVTTQEAKQENAKGYTLGNHRAHKTKSTNTKRKTFLETVQTGIHKNKAAKEKQSEGGKKRHKSTKESKPKSSSRKHNEKAHATTLNKTTTGKKTKYENGDKVGSLSKVGNIKSILKKSHIPQEINNNPEYQVSPENWDDNDDTVELNLKAIFHSPSCSKDNSDDECKEMETSNDKANSSTLANNNALVYIPDIIVKQEIHDAVPEVRNGMVKLVDAVLNSLHDDLLYDELSDSPLKKTASTDSIETLVLGNEGYEDESM